MTRSICLLLIPVVSTSCVRQGQVQKFPSMPLPSTPAKEEDCLSEEDLDLKELEVRKNCVSELEVREVTELWVEESYGWPNYEISRVDKRNDGWWVLVWKLPAQPGGHVNLEVDCDGIVVRVWPGA